NVLLSWEGGVKLTDFGLARARAGGAASADGTAPYAAPEQLAGRRVDGRADVFALGMVLREAGAGEMPRARGRGIERATAGGRGGGCPTAAALRRALVELPGRWPDPARALRRMLARLRPRPREARALLALVDRPGPVTRVARPPGRRPLGIAARIAAGV